MPFSNSFILIVAHPITQYDDDVVHHLVGGMENLQYHLSTRSNHP